MNGSTGIGESGARSHRERTNRTPVDSTITTFILSMPLLERYIMNCIGSLTMNILFRLYIQGD